MEGEEFYTLYGHLSLDSLKDLEKEKKFSKGDKIAEAGSYEVNGNWPSHLHFEIITDMQGKEGDFPSVAKLSEKEKYSKICLDPNLILRF